MSSGYTRQSAAEIIPNAVVKSSSFNAELNKIRDAFKFSTDTTTGHTHDGSSDEGSYVPLIADIDGNNKVVVNTTDNRIEFYVSVSDSPVEQVRLQDGAIVPVSDNDIDLGTDSREFKNLYLDGTAKVDTLTVDENTTVAGTLGVTGDTTVGNIEATGTLDVAGLSTLETVSVTTEIDVPTPTEATHPATKAYVDGIPGTVGALSILNNLSDLDDASTARDNLGVNLTYISSNSSTGGVSSFDFTSGITSDYNHYLFVFDGVYPQNDGSDLRVRTTNGGGFDSGSSDYYSRGRAFFGTASDIDFSSTGASFYLVAGGLSDVISDAFFGEMKLWSPSGTDSYTRMTTLVTGESSTGNFSINLSSGARLETSNVTGVQFYMSSGNIRGAIHMYGVSI